jgi:hypothetical protein
MESHAMRSSVTKAVRIRLKKVKTYYPFFGSTNHTLTSFEGKGQQQNKNVTNSSLQLFCLMHVRKGE